MSDGKMKILHSETLPLFIRLALLLSTKVFTKKINNALLSVMTKFFAKRNYKYILPYLLINSKMESRIFIGLYSINCNKLEPETTSVMYVLNNVKNVFK